MALDPNIALSYRPQQAQQPNLFDQHLRALTLASLLDQRRQQADEAERKYWQDRGDRADKEKAASFLRTVGLKATGPDGQLNRDVLLSELVRGGYIKEGAELDDKFSGSEKRRSDVRKQDIESQQSLMGTGMSMLMGVQEMGELHGYDHPAVQQANLDAKRQYNTMAKRAGLPTVPEEGRASREDVMRGIEFFKTQAQRNKEMELQTPEERAARKYDRSYSGQGDMGTVETTGGPTDDRDIDSILSGTSVPTDEGVQIQTFNPDEIRSEEQGGVIEGQAPRMIQTGMPPVRTTMREVVAPTKPLRLTPRVLVDQALGGHQAASSPFKWNERGEAVLDPAVQSAKLAQAKAGASSTKIDVAVGDKKLAEGIATPLGKSIENTNLAARKSAVTIEQVRDLTNALSDGDLIVGPGANARLWVGRLAQAMGVTGKDHEQTLTNTRKAIQTLAQQELDAAIQMRGQGQITEAEREIIRRAASGDVNANSLPEMRMLVETLEKTSRRTIQENKRFTDLQRQQPEQFGALPDFMDVQEPPAVKFPWKKEAAPQSREMDSLPDPASMPGKRIRDNSSGTTYRSQGGKWVRE